MHTCSPPINALNERFNQFPIVDGNFGHLLLVQKSPDDGTLCGCLGPYFESAHLDARQRFHEELRDRFDPDAVEDEESPVSYPNSLPSTTLRGLFGEVFAGLVTQGYPLVGSHQWSVPVFLFRFHEDARNYLFDLARNPERKRQVIGRLGSDFIGIQLDTDGVVTRFICGEAKWRLTLTPSAVDEIMLGEWTRESPVSPRVRSGKGVWSDVNSDSPVPIGVRQITEDSGRECSGETYDAAILWLERALVLRGGTPLPRTDLILVVGNARATRKETERLLPYEGIPHEYTGAGNDLQLVEVVMQQGELLIEALYGSLFAGGSNA